MQVLIIGRGYPNKWDHMYGIFEYQQAQAISKKCKVIYCALDMRSIRHRRKVGVHYKKNGNVDIVILNIPCGRIPLKLFNIIGIFSLKKMYRLIENRYGKADVVHVHFTELAYIATEVFYEIGIPVIVTEHSSKVFQNKLSNQEKRCAISAYKKAKIVTAVSSEFSKTITENFGIQVRCVHNMVDVREFYLKQHTRTNIIVSVGSLVVGKRMDLLISTFYSAFKTQKEKKLIIIGEGNEHKRLQELINELKLQEQVFLVGKKSHDEMCRILQKSDFFALFSKSETFGVAYIEAMACGLPVIATNCGGVNDFITDKNGIIVYDEKEIVSSLVKMDNECYRYDRKFICDYVNDSFSEEKISDEFIKIYSEQ